MRARETDEWKERERQKKGREENQMNEGPVRTEEGQRKERVTKDYMKTYDNESESEKRLDIFAQ